MKTYIIPTGWDRELVLKTAFKSGADHVCLVSAYPKKDHSYSQADLITKKVNEHLVKELSKFTQVETLEVNYVDFNDIVLRLNKYIADHPDHEFLINISTGSHLLAATLMFVGFLNAIPIEYSIAQTHNPKIMEIVSEGGDYHCGFSKILQLPSLPVSVKISPKEKKFLNHIKTKGRLDVKTFIGNAQGNMENRLRSEFHYLCKTLEKQGMIAIQNQGKKIEIQLTPFGELWV